MTIRRAIQHQLEDFQSKIEQEAIVRSFISMKTDKNYLKESKEIAEKLNTNLRLFFKQEVIYATTLFTRGLINPFQNAF